MNTLKKNALDYFQKHLEFNTLNHKERVYGANQKIFQLLEKQEERFGLLTTFRELI